MHIKDSALKITIFALPAGIIAVIIAMCSQVLLSYLTPYGVSGDVEAESVYQIAIQKKDISICDKVHIAGFSDASDKAIHNNCYAQYARSIPDEDICGRVGNGFDCVSARAKALNNATLCLSTNNDSQSNWKAYCVAMVATKISDKKACLILQNTADEQACEWFFARGI